MRIEGWMLDRAAPYDHKCHLGYGPSADRTGKTSASERDGMRLHTNLGWLLEQGCQRCC